MAVYGGALGLGAWAALLVGFAYAAYTDLATREAPDGVWIGLGAAGTLLGALAVAPGGALPWLAWVLVSALVLEHFAPWDVPLERISEALPGAVEIGIYAGVGAVLGGLAWKEGVGATAIPEVALAAYVVVVLVRVAFELGLLYGGADAKALMAAALLIPLAPVVLTPLPTPAQVANFIPGPLNLLMNAALLSVAVPIGIALRNLRGGTFEGAASFIGYPIPVAELSRRFVWLRDPTLAGRSSEEAEIESTEDDVRLRQRQQAELEARGIPSVWVTPQLPFLVFFLAGAIATLVAGNLLFDLLALA